MQKDQSDDPVFASYLLQANPSYGDFGRRHKADVQEEMFRTCFKLLGEFLHRRCGYVGIANGGSYRGYRILQVDPLKHAVDLWVWYWYELPALEREYHTDIRGFTEKYGARYIESQKDEKMRMLMEVRPSLIA